MYLSISVADSGCGMNEEMKKKCCTLFGNLKFKKEINQGGMGLGLASASLICKALQGELNLLRSEENVGSKFQFTMSVKIGSDIENVEVQDKKSMKEAESKTALNIQLDQ